MHLTKTTRLRGSFPETSSLEEKTSSFPGQHKRVILSDPVLSSYRDSLNEVIAFLQSKNIQVNDLREFGLALNAPTLSADQLCQAIAEESRHIEKKPSAAPIIIAPETVHKLCIEMLNAIDACMEAINTIITNPTSVQNLNTEDILSKLEDLDFLFYDLADREWPSLSPAALVQAYVKLGYFRSYISKRLNPHQS